MTAASNNRTDASKFQWRQYYLQRAGRVLRYGAVWALNGLERRFTERDIVQWKDLVVQPTKTGVQVNEDVALTYLALFACVELLTKVMASLPLSVYRRVDSKRRLEADAHPLYQLLRLEPNPEMTAYKWRETTFAHVLLWGNGYSEIVYDNSGNVAQLWPLTPSRVTPRRLKDAPGKPIVYDVALPDGTTTRLSAANVLHFRGLGPTGLVGYSRISLAREVIGLGLATEEYTARFYGNNASPGGVLEHPKTLKPGAQKNITESWEREHAGLSNAHRIAVLEEGMQWKQIGVAPEDAQLIETRKFNRTDMAALFGIPQHMIGALDRATFSNIEQQSLEFVIYCLSPWCVNFEQQMNMSLLLPSERRDYYVKHNLDGLLRGDIASRYTAYATGRNGGWLSANEVREKEDMDPIENNPDAGPGDTYIRPLNAAAIGSTKGNDNGANDPARDNNNGGNGGLQ